MKIEVWIRKNGEEKLFKVYENGKDWKGIRCYFQSPKGAYVDYKQNTFFITSSRSRKLGVWYPFGDGDEKYEFIKED